MSLSMHVGTIINSLVRQLLIRGNGRDGEALHFGLDLRMSHYIENKSFNVSRGLHLLYHCRAGYRYVDVFSGVTDSPRSNIKSVSEWNHECSHDDCWRDIRTFHDVYMDMANEINRQMIAFGLSEVAPADMHECNSFHPYDEVFGWVPVRVSKDPRCEISYRKLIQLL